MIDDCDDRQDDQWPDDDEANDIMLAYAATEGSCGSRSGCAGVVIILAITIFASIRAWG